MERIIPFMTMHLLVYGTSSAFEIEITPAYKIAAQIGDKLVLTCSTTGCETPSFSWRPQMDSPLSGTVNYTGNSSVLTMDPVGFANEQDYLCSASCGKEKKEKNVKVDIYSFPRDPVIEISTPLNVGGKASVTCKVDRVYPSDRLVLQLEKNGSVLYRREFYEDISTKTTEAKSLTWTFSPTFEDIGKEITCVAELPIDGMEFEPKKRQTSQRLSVTSSAFEIEITPAYKIAAQIGDKLVLTCSTTGCETPSFSWRAQMDSPLSGTVSHTGNSSILTMDPVGFANEQDYLCSASCGKLKKEKNIKVDIYSFPRDPVIEISTPLNVGGKASVTCKVDRVYPSDRLVLQLEKNGSVLYRREFYEDISTKTTEAKSLTWTFSPTFEDIGKEITCVAELPIDGMEFEPKKRQTSQRLSVTSSAFEIEITPAYKIAAQIGDKLVLTCSTTGCETPSFSWRAQMDSPLSGTVSHTGNSSILTMDPVGFANEQDYLCSASCGKLKKEKNIKVDIYSFPRDPVIEISTPLNVGGKASVTCKVDRVYPSDRLVLQLEKNGSVLYRREFYEDISTKTTEAKSLTWTFSPTFEDIGKEITCVAELPIDGMEFEPKKRQTSQRLSVTSSAFEIEITPAYKIAAQIGDKLVLTCSTTGCETPSFSWRAQMDSPLSGTVSHTGNSSILTMDPVGFANEQDYLCSASCGKLKKEKNIKVDIYSFPRDPVIEISTPLNVGGKASVTCKVDRVYPSDRLVLQLEKNGSVLYRREFYEDISTKTTEAKSLTWTFSPTFEDIGKEITCVAELPIDGMEFEPKKRQTSQRLSVTSSAFEIEITPAYKIAAQIGDKLVLTCSTTGCETPSFSWRAQMDSPLSGTVSHTGNSSILTMDPVGFANEQDYLCSASCGKLKKEKNIKVDIYSFPRDPVIEISTPLNVGGKASVTCKVDRVYPSDRLVLQLEKNGSVLYRREFYEDISTKTTEAKSLTWTFSPTFEDIGKEITCVAELPIDGMEFEPKKRQTSQRLSVTSSAFEIEITPAYKIAAQIGDKLVLTCSTTGCETPSFSWRAQMDSPLSGTVSHTGNSSILTMDPVGFANEQDYLCSASCGKLKKEKNIKVDIYYGPGNTTVSVSPSATVREGEAVTMTCTSYENIKKSHYLTAVIVMVSSLSTIAIPTLAVLVYRVRKASVNKSYHLVNALKPNV